MDRSDVLKAWGRILTGRKPSLSIEITRECPLRCPGCYAYEDNHLSGPGQTLRSVADYKGADLIDRILELVRQYKPLLYHAGFIRWQQNRDQCGPAEFQ